MLRKDFIVGNVREVVGDDTFSVKVNRTGRKNRGEYGDVEMVCIKSLKASEIVTLSWMRKKFVLEKILKDREVVCVVKSRDAKGGIEADVYIIQAPGEDTDRFTPSPQ